ncbi:MAG: hypothetical protein QOE92_1861 [Chloroflexota bacterium]|jgi:ABC-type transport system involved in multi-copper enzyme maturation permease subunit|nr:hypothetical protein [Chloroflexota bacterium]
MKVLAIALYTVRELARRKLLYFLIGGGALLVILAGIGLVLLRANAPEGTVPVGDYSGFVLITMTTGISFFGVSFFTWIAAVAISVTLINHDLESGSVVSIFSKPVSRLEYAAGKVLAAAATLLVTSTVLGVGTWIVVLSQGGGHEAPLAKTFVLIAANQLTQMLIILPLSVRLNNIVAAIIGVVVVQLAKLVGTAHLLMHAIQDVGTPISSTVSDGFRLATRVVDVLYWLVPRYLESDLQKEVYSQSSDAAFSGSSPLINVSDWTDVAFWAAWIALLFALLFLALRSREV